MQVVPAQRRENMSSQRAQKSFCLSGKSLALWAGKHIICNAIIQLRMKHMNPANFMGCRRRWDWYAWQFFVSFLPPFGKAMLSTYHCNVPLKYLQKYTSFLLVRCSHLLPGHVRTP